MKYAIAVHFLDTVTSPNLILIESIHPHYIFISTQLYIVLHFRGYLGSGKHNVLMLLEEGVEKLKKTAVMTCLKRELFSVVF